MQVTDGLGRWVEVNTSPQRIVSLVPSLTELLFDLGLGGQVVGVTRFCTRPEEARTQATRVGGTKQFDFKKIESLNPDLIIANKEENYKEGIEQLMPKYPTYVSDILDLDDAISTMEDIGKLTNAVGHATHMCKQVRKAYDSIKGMAKGSVLYFIWQKPDMVAGSDNFIDFTLNWLGFDNCAGDISRYPQMSASELADKSPEYVMLSSEPFPFKDKHIDRYRTLFPEAKVLLVDGEMFSWYGSRLLRAPDYFAGLPL